MRWAFDDFERIKNRRKWLFDKWNEHLSAGLSKLLRAQKASWGICTVWANRNSKTLINYFAYLIEGNRVT